MFRRGYANRLRIVGGPNGPIVFRCSECQQKIFAPDEFCRRCGRRFLKTVGDKWSVRYKIVATTIIDRVTGQVFRRSE